MTLATLAIMSSKPAKQSRKDGAVKDGTLKDKTDMGMTRMSSTPGDFNMTALTSLLEEHRAALSAEFKSCISTLEVKLDRVQTAVTDHEQRISCFESAAEVLDSRLRELETTCAALVDSNAKLKAKTADLEARSCRNNIRIVGLPESTEGPRPTAFFSELLRKVLGEEILPSLPELDRAHRSLTSKPLPGEKPRAVIIRFHRYQEKDRVVREARRRRGELRYDGKPIAIFEDFSPEVLEQRSVYKGIMAELYKHGFKPSLLYPARLRITTRDGGKVNLPSVNDGKAYLKAHAAGDGAAV